MNQMMMALVWLHLIGEGPFGKGPVNSHLQARMSARSIGVLFRYYRKLRRFGNLLPEYPRKIVEQIAAPIDGIVNTVERVVDDVSDLLPGKIGGRHPPTRPGLRLPPHPGLSDEDKRKNLDEFNEWMRYSRPPPVRYIRPPPDESGPSLVDDGMVEADSPVLVSMSGGRTSPHGDHHIIQPRIPIELDGNNTMLDNIVHGFDIVFGGIPQFNDNVGEFHNEPYHPPHVREIRSPKTFTRETKIKVPHVDRDRDVHFM